MTPPTDRSDWPLILTLFATGLLAAWQFGKVALVLPQLAAGYGGAAVELAWLVSIVGLVGIAIGAVAGNVVAALGARRVLLGAIWLGAALSAVQVLWLPLWALAVTRVAEGVSHAMVVVAAPTLIAGAASGAGRPVAMGLWAMFFGVAFAIGAVIFPPFVDALGVPALFAVHAAGLAAMALLLAPRLVRQPRLPLRLDLWAVHRRIYAEPAHALPGLSFVFYTILFVALVTLLPVGLERADLAVTLPLISLAGTFGAGWLSKRWQPQRVAGWGFAATGALAAACWAGAGWAVYPLFVTMGLVPGACFALIPHLNPTTAGRALATGGIAQMGNVGTTLGTPLFALALAGGGQGAVWAGTLAMCAAGLATLVLLGRRIPAGGTLAGSPH